MKKPREPKTACHSFGLPGPRRRLRISFEGSSDGISWTGVAGRVALNPAGFSLKGVPHARQDRR